MDFGTLYCDAAITRIWVLFLISSDYENAMIIHESLSLALIGAVPVTWLTRQFYAELDHLWSCHVTSRLLMLPLQDLIIRTFFHVSPAIL